MGTADPRVAAELVEALVDPVERVHRARDVEHELDALGEPRAAAVLGVRILMLRGIHNFSGETCEVKKRVLIKVRPQHPNETPHIPPTTI